MTIEQQLVRDYGITTNPKLAVWLLKDGTLVNGSYCGHQRDIDHREVSQYFKRSKFEDPGSASIYLRKFMRRGNIRMGCSEVGYTLEYAVTPTKEQLKVISDIMLSAQKKNIQTAIGHYRKHENTRYLTFWDFVEHMLRYTRAEFPQKVLLCR